MRRLIYGDIWGVVDHCTFDSSDEQHQGVSVNHSSWNHDPGGWADYSYEDPLHLGTDRAVYVEDCTFIGQGTAGVMDGTWGGRFVFRHNTVTDAFLGMHGTEGQRFRGLRSFEIYPKHVPLPRYSNFLLPVYSQRNRRDLGQHSDCRKRGSRRCQFRLGRLLSPATTATATVGRGQWIKPVGWKPAARRLSGHRSGGQGNVPRSNPGR